MSSPSPFRHEQLLKMGFVDKENFDEEDAGQYAREKRSNQVLVERAQMEAKTRADSAKAFDDWLLQKEMRDQALGCLRLIARPALDGEGGGAMDDDMRGSRASNTYNHNNSTTNMSTTKLLLRNPNNGEIKHAIEVGKALKRVDRTLFKEWAGWCEAVFKTNVASVLWDFFPPMACDVHSAAYSQVRDSFIKLLRPGVDFRQTFMDFVETNIFARRVNRFKSEKEYYRLRDDAREELDEEIQGMRKQWLEEVSISKSSMKTLLLQLGA